MRNIYIILGLTVVNIIVLALCSLFIVKSYKGLSASVSPEIEFIFEEAIGMEAYKRLDDNNIPFYYFEHPSTPSETHHTLITEQDTSYVEKKPDYNYYSREKKMVMGQQTMLVLSEVYVNVYELDSIFNAELKHVGIVSKTAVKFTNNLTNEIFYSDSDSSFYKSAYYTEEITTGVKGEVTLQGFYTLTVWGLHDRFTGNMWLAISLGIFLLILLPVLLYFLYWSWKIFNAKPEDKIEILPGIIYEKKRHALYNKYCEITLTKQMIQLFDLFAQEENRTVSYKVITTTIWGNKIDDTGDRLTQLVKRSRQKLQEIQVVWIDNIPGLGYRLVLIEPGSRSNGNDNGNGNGKTSKATIK